MTSTLDPTAAARAILTANDRGGDTAPAARHPASPCNWQATVAAAALATFDIPRAYRELERLIAGQWTDGMIAHQTFDAGGDGTGAAEGLWRTTARTRGRPRTSGISHPPLLGLVLRRLHEAALGAGDAALPQRSYAVFHAALKWQRWWCAARDPEGTGVVALLHPWESGHDAAPDWDQPSAGMPTASAVALLEAYADTGWDATAVWRQAAFKVADVQTTALLARSSEDLIALSYSLGTPDEQAELLDMHSRLAAGLARHWRVDLARFCDRDLLSGRDLTAPTPAGFLPLLALDLDDFQRMRVAAELSRWLEAGCFRLQPPANLRPDLAGSRSTFGPAWLLFHALLLDGLERNRLEAVAARLRRDTLDALRHAGLHGGADPVTGLGEGASPDSWCAAAWLLLADRTETDP